MRTATLVLEHIVKTFGKCDREQTLFRGLQARFEQGTTYAITGVSGMGKSTLLHCLAGFEQPTSGNVIYNGQALTAFTAEQLRQYRHNDLGLMFQKPYLIKELSVLENVMLKGLIGGMSYAEGTQEGMRLLERVGLAHKAESDPGALSGGEQQRVTLARALFTKPTFILADEPTAHLDELSRAIVVELLLECQQQWQAGLIVSTHDPYVAQRMMHMYVIHDGILELKGA